MPPIKFGIAVGGDYTKQTENINNIEVGAISDYRSYAPGFVVFTVSVGNNSPIVDTVVMAECFEYDIVIGSNNLVVSTPRDRNDD